MSIAFILVHLGPSDPKSAEVLDLIEQSGVKIITKILATDDSTKQWLSNNDKGVVVTKYPSFLIAQAGRSTQIYSADEADYVIGMARRLTE